MKLRKLTQKLANEFKLLDLESDEELARPTKRVRRLENRQQRREVRDELRQYLS